MTKQTNETRENLLANLALVWPEAKLGKISNADLVWLAQVAQHLDEAGSSKNMAATLAKYRMGYEDTASYSGRLSKHNGDDVAAILAGAEPGQVMAAAEALLGLEAGELVAKYDRLNPGQKRMNAGNRIRAAIKRGDATIEDLQRVWH